MVSFISSPGRVPQVKHYDTNPSTAMKMEKQAMSRVILCGLLAVAGLISVSPALAQDRGACTRQCGGRPGGEAANPPSVVACFRRCMGVQGNNDGAGRSGQQNRSR
jgi:hypothetical protein